MGNAVAHGHSNNHKHGHSHVGIDLSDVENVDGMLRAIKIGIFLNFAIFAADLAVWYFLTPSVAILGASIHNIFHSIIWITAYWGISLSKRPPTDNHTYGQKRKNILASTVIAQILILTAFLVAFIGYQRIISPKEVVGALILVMAGIDLATNIFMVSLIAKYKKSSTVKGVLWDVVLDIFGAVAVFVNGAVIILFAFHAADGIAAIIIGAVSVGAAIHILADTLPILSESTPKEIKEKGGRAEVVKFISRFHGFSMPHDVHIWKNGEHDILLPCHVAHADISHMDEHREELVRALHDKFGIEHATIQIESADCPSKCEIPQPIKNIILHSHGDGHHSH